MDAGQAWLITGANGCGSADFIRALAGEFEFVPSSEDALFSNVFKESVAIVSLEKAAALIEEERANDESEILNRIDEGRTGRRFLCEVLGGSTRRHDPLPDIAQRLETLPEVKLCGVQNILDRGLKFMSTGEVRRMLL
jgi:molybdate transport system ATP-binding protein